MSENKLQSLKKAIDINGFLHIIPFCLFTRQIFETRQPVNSKAIFENQAERNYVENLENLVLKTMI